MRILLSKEEVKSCYNFAEKAWSLQSQSQKHFGGRTRTKEQFLADQTEGKLAELVLMKSLNQLGLIINLDFNHYEGQLNTDEGDFKISLDDRLIKTKVDIKGSSFFAQWLLVEDYKFIDPLNGRLKSNAFVLVCFGKSFPGNRELRENPKILLEKEIEGEVRGWALAEDFYEPKERKFWFEWPKGSTPWVTRVLPRTKPLSRRGLDKYLEKSVYGPENVGKKNSISITLDAKKNYGLPITWLRTDWQEFISFLLNYN